MTNYYVLLPNDTVSSQDGFVIMSEGETYYGVDVDEGVIGVHIPERDDIYHLKSDNFNHGSDMFQTIDFRVSDALTVVINVSPAENVPSIVKGILDGISIMGIQD